MTMWRCASFLFLLVLVSAAHVASENGGDSLTIVVADFDLDALAEADMVEYVDYLAFQIEKTVGARTVSTSSGFDVQVVRASGTFKRRRAERRDASSPQVIVDGVLKRSEGGYAVLVRVAGAVSGSSGKRLEYAYTNEQELYSGCAEVAGDIAGRIFGIQQNEHAPVEAIAAVGMKTELGWISATSATARGGVATFLLTTWVFPLSFLPVGLDFLWSKNLKEDTASYLFGVELYLSIVLVSAGVSFVVENAPNEQIPYLGLRFRLLDIPPVLRYALGNAEKPPTVDLGVDLLPITIRWSLKTGRPVFTIGIVSVTLGHFFFPE